MSPKSVKLECPLGDFLFSGVVAPGMVGRRDGTGLQVFEHAVDVFGLDDIGLLGLFVESGEREELAFVVDGDVIAGIQGDGDGGIAQGIRGAVNLDLVDDLSELNGQVFGEDVLLLPGKDLSQVVGFGKGAMSIMGRSGLNGEAAVEIVDEYWEEGIASFPIGDAA